MKSNTLRTIVINAPIVVENNLPIALQFQVQSRNRLNKKDDENHDIIPSGGKKQVMECEYSQNPLFAFCIHGYEWSTWMPIKEDKTVSIVLKMKSKSPFLKLVIQVKPLEKSGKVHINVFAPCWIINRTGYVLQYGNETNTEIWDDVERRPMGIDTRFTICDLPSQLRLRASHTKWSTRFRPDAKKLSWRDECLTLHGDTSSSLPNSTLELGITVDYATRLFGNYTVLVSILPRYWIWNRTGLSLFSRELGTCVYYHTIEVCIEQPYVLQWANGKRTGLAFSWHKVSSSEDYYAEPFNQWNREGTYEVYIPKFPTITSSGQWVQITVKRGSQTEASFVIIITIMDQEAKQASLSSSSSLLKYVDDSQVIRRIDVYAEGLLLILKLPNNSDYTMARSEERNLARIGIARIKIICSSTSTTTHTLGTMESFTIDDILLKSPKTILSPVTAMGMNNQQPFLKLLVVEQSIDEDQPFRCINDLQLIIQPLKLKPTTGFITQLQKVITYTKQSYLGVEVIEDRLSDLMVVYCTSSLLANSSSVATDTKIYFENFKIQKLSIYLTYKKDAESEVVQSFWVRNLRLEIDNAALVFEPYVLSNAFATTQLVESSIFQFYYQSVKTQAIGLIDPIAIPSLAASFITNAVTDGVSNMFNLIGGTSDASLLEEHTFKRQTGLSNHQIIAKHSTALGHFQSRVDFVRILHHLVFDWDSNHQGIDARHCTSLAIINSSRNAITLQHTLQEGDKLCVLPPGRTFLSSVRAEHFQHTSWQSDRAVILFGYGSLPIPMLSTGNVVFQVQSNAFHAYITLDTGSVKSLPGYTAAFTEQRIEKWWSRHVLLISDDIDKIASPRTNNTRTDLTYEEVFSTARLGILAHMMALNNVRVKKYESMAEGAGEQIQIGDKILSVNGIAVRTAQQFKTLVQKAHRPVIIRFERDEVVEEGSDDTDLFGPPPPVASSKPEDAFSLFG